MNIIEPEVTASDLEYPDPTSADLHDPLFDVIWNAIKKWDIQRRVGDGYAVATGNDVMHILSAIRNYGGTK